MSVPGSPQLLGRSQLFSRSQRGTGGYHSFLNLEVISNRRVRLLLITFYACIGVAWAGFFTAHEIRWQCTTLCLQNVSSDERNWNASALPASLCRNATARDTLWQGAPLQLDPLNVHLQLLLVVPNSAALSAAVASEVGVSVSLGMPGGSVQTNWTYPLSCDVGREFCRSIGLYILPNLTSGAYQAAVTVFPAQVVTGADLQATALPLPNAYPIMCHHTIAHTAINIALRTLGLLVIIIVFVQFARQSHWREFWHWSPEQKWLLLLFLGTTLQLNPFYFGYLFVSDLSNAAGRTFLFFQGCSSWFYRYVQMGFEVVLLCCSQAFPFYICGMLHYGLLEGFGWAAGMIGVYVAYFTVHGFTYRTREFYLNYLEWPPLGTFTTTDGNVCSVMLLFFVSFWYLWIFNLTYVTHRHLKAVPYLRNRAQQLSYRWFIATFLVYDVSWLVGYIYHLAITDTQLPRLTLEDLPGANVLALPAVVAYTVVASTLYTPHHIDMLNAPPHPESWWWITVKWPQRWFDWLDSHGRMLHFFRTEEEKHQYEEAQRQQVDLPDYSVFLSDLQEDSSRVQLLRNNLRVMTEETRQGWDRLCEALSPYNSFTQDAEAEMETEEEPPFAAPQRVRPFFCVETAMKMWNLSWEVYWNEPPEFRPGRCTTAAEMAATKALPWRWEDGHQSRLQYLWNSRCTVAQAVRRLHRSPSSGSPGPSVLEEEPNEAEVIERFPEEVFWHWRSVQAFTLPDTLRRLSERAQAEAADREDKAKSASTSGPLSTWCRDVRQKLHRRTYDANLMDELSAEMAPTQRSPLGAVPGVVADSPGQWPSVSTSDTAMRRSQCWSGYSQPPSTLRTSPPQSHHAPLPSRPDYCPSPTNSDAAWSHLPDPIRIPRRGSDVRAREDARPSQRSSPLRGFPPLRSTETPNRHWDSQDLLSRTTNFSVLEELLREPPQQPPQRRRLGDQKAMMLERYGYQLLWVLNRNHAQVLIAVSDSELGIAFRGTKNRQNVRADLQLHQEVMVEFVDPATVPEPAAACPRWMWRWWSGIHVPKAHAGFYTTYRCLRVDLLSAVQRFAQEYPHLPLYVTGHSLGGALATFLAYDLAKLLPGRTIVMYNFGCPRVGNAAFKKLFTEQVPESYRVVNDCDVVPVMLPQCTPLGSIYHHVGQEVRIDPQGNMIIRPTVLERVFPTRKSRMLAHLMSNYRRSLEAVCQFYRVRLPRHVLPYSLRENPLTVG